MLHVLGERVEYTCASVACRGEEIFKDSAPVAPYRLVVQLPAAADGAEGQPCGGQFVDVSGALAHAIQEGSRWGSRRRFGVRGDRSTQACAISMACLLHGRREILRRCQRSATSRALGAACLMALVNAIRRSRHTISAPGCSWSQAVTDPVSRSGRTSTGAWRSRRRRERAVGPPLAERELVDAQDPRRLGQHGWGDQLTEQSSASAWSRRFAHSRWPGVHRVPSPPLSSPTVPPVRDGDVVRSGPPPVPRTSGVGTGADHRRNDAHADGRSTPARRRVTRISDANTCWGPAWQDARMRTPARRPHPAASTTKLPSPVMSCSTMRFRPGKRTSSSVSTRMTEGFPDRTILQSGRRRPEPRVVRTGHPGS